MVCLCVCVWDCQGAQQNKKNKYLQWVTMWHEPVGNCLLSCLSNFHLISTAPSTHPPLQSLEQWTRVKHPTLCCCSCSCHASSCSVVAAIRCNYFTAGQHSRHNCWGVTDHRNKKWERRCWSFLSGILQSHRPFRHCKLTVTCLEGLRCMSLMWH